MDKKAVARLKPESLDLAERSEDMFEVAQLWMQTNKTGSAYNKISKELGLSRAYVETLVAEFKQIYMSNETIRQRAQEIVGEFDLTYDHVKAELYRAAKDAEMENDIKTRVTALKNVADIEAKRVDTLQKSGLLANMDLADEIAEQERKYEALKKLIIDVVKHDPSLRTEVARRLSVIEGRAEPTGNVVVVEDE
jgi:myo-inositol-1-phosphate synthase